MRSDAAALRRNGDARGAQLLDDWARRWDAATEDHRVFVSETDALLAGTTRAYLARNRAGWATRGDARVVKRQWYYRRSVLPAPTPASIAREAGRQGLRPPAAVPATEAA